MFTARSWLWIVSCFGTMGLLACAPASQDRERVQARGSADRLTSTEWSSYLADRQYLHALVPVGQQVHLNYADPRQYNFVVARLKLVGKDANNSPHLFEVLETRRQQQIARGAALGALANTAPVAVIPVGPQEMHYIETADPGTGPGLRIATGTAGSTFPGGAPYTYVDLTISTITGLPIAPLGFAEEFDNADGVPGANVTASTSGDPTVSPIKRYVFDSYNLVDRGDGEIVDSLLRVENGSAVAQPQAALPVLSAPVVNAPGDTTGDNKIRICLDRALTNDCDVTLQGPAQPLNVPLKGSVSVTSSHVFDAATIQTVKDKLNLGQPANGGQVLLVLTNGGGGCAMIDRNTRVAQMAPFWNHVTLSPDLRTVSWDLSDANAAFFDDGCRQIQDAAKLTMRIPLPLLAIPSGEPFLTSITISNDPGALRDASVLPITLTNN